MPDRFRCGLVLLAAGASQRMGRPKQLLPLGAQPLLRRVAAQALAAPVAPVVVVLGARADEIAPALAGLAVRIAINAQWAAGMGSSLRLGAQSLLRQAPELDALIVALADQPDALGGEHAARLIDAHRATGRGIAASVAAGRTQPPVLFGRTWFPRLLALDGAVGAHRLLDERPDDVALVPLAAAADLDTPDDYERFINSNPDDPSITAR